MVIYPLIGNLSTGALKPLRTSEIQCLDLAISMADEEGLDFWTHRVSPSLYSHCDPLLAADSLPGTDSFGALQIK